MTNDEDRSPVASLPISVVVPVRDFAIGIPRFLAAWGAQLERLGKIHEFVVVDDGSSDGTPGVVGDAAFTNLTSHRNDAPAGLGAAIRRGVQLARHPVVLIVAPELPFRPSDLPGMLTALDQVDLVAPVRSGSVRPRWLATLGRLIRLASRVVFGIPAQPPGPWYGWSAARGRMAWRALFGLRLHDPACPMKLVRRELLDRCPIQADGRFSFVELVAKANFAGALMAEVELSRPGDLPAMKHPFEHKTGDVWTVLKRPTFAPPPVRPAVTDATVH
jgi:glycosyltransferase involved in cell wall biosynthesis